jgi:magnesium transporter
MPGHIFPIGYGVRGENMSEIPTHEAQTQLGLLRTALGKGKDKRVRRILKSMHPAKIASLLEALSGEERLATWQQVDPGAEQKVLSHLNEELRAVLLQEAAEAGKDGEPVDETTQLQRLWDALKGDRRKQVRRILEGTHPARTAGLLESLPTPMRLQAWEAVDNDVAGQVLVHLHGEARAGLVVATEMEELVDIVQGMDLDDLTDLMQDLPLATSRALLQSLDRRKGERLRAMLSYPEDSAGGLMNTDHITVRRNVSLGTVLRYLRALGDLPDHTDKFMVVDRQERYLGILRLRRLVTGRPELLVSEAMESDFPPIPASVADEEVARRFSDQDLVSSPVVNDEGRLVGRITVDDVVDVIRGESEQTLMNLAGMDEDEDMFAPVLLSARRRALWLGINLVTAFIAAWVIGLFEGTLEKIVALAVLMPIVASMGGIAGSQTLTVMIRGLALGQVERRNARILMAKEIGVGLLNGLLWAIVVAGLAVVWFGSVGIGGTIAAAMVINLFCAAIAGVIIPLALRRMGIDPALAGSVVLTTVTDVVGFLAFLGLATLLLL